MSRYPTERFSLTVENYLKYRPSYPREILSVLIKECGLTPNTVIADIGSGTGFLTKLFLDYGNKVYGVEPNQEMREAGENYLSQYQKFASVDGTAETTNLPNHCVDIVTAGTAYHWFDREKAKWEFKRILRSPGWLVVIWNVRDIEESPLAKDYEELILQYGTDYQGTNAELFDKSIAADAFSPNEMKIAVFENMQVLDWEGLKGRLLSASYSLRKGDARCEEMLEALQTIFARHQKNSKVTFLYKTKMYYGRLT